LVLVVAVVTGKHGEFIRDLKPTNFTVLEDEKPQKNQRFQRACGVGIGPGPCAKPAAAAKHLHKLHRAGARSFTSAPGTRNAVNANFYVQALHKTSATLASSQIAVYPISVRGLETNGPGASDMGGVLGFSDRALQTFTRWSTEYRMEDIARETGGEAFYNQNDLRNLTLRRLDEGTSYYTLAYVPEDRDWDGRYRKMEV
jgi:hypothetical protein